MNKVNLRELCKPSEIGKYGIPASAEDFDENKVRYLRITDIDDNGNLLHTDKKSVTSHDIEKYILKEGDIVFARTGNSTGRTYFHERKNGILAFAGFLIKFGLDESKVNPKYLKYYTVSNEYKQWVKNLSVGSTRGNINAQTFADCPISMPPRNQQDLLVKVLSSLDVKIELNNRINTELEAIAKTIYDYWFVQFDFPISAEQAKAMGKPELEGKPYKSSGGNMVWNAALKREVPEGWEIKKIKEISQTGSGGTPLSSKKEYYESGNIPWINSGEVNSSFIIESSKFITQEGLQNSSAKIFPKGTILMAMYGATAGQVSLMEIEACTNQAICAIIPYNSKMIPFLKFALHDIYKHLVNLSSGSARDNLSQDKIRDLEFAIPEKSLIENFHEIANFNFSKIIICLRENRELSTLRDWLLPMLMNGQVKVEN